MEKERESKVPVFELNYKIWLSTPDGKGILGDGKWKVLKTIEETGSLKAACDAMGYTYRKTWANLKKIEEMLNISLLEKQRGGKTGGRTTLTREGKRLVKAFTDFHTSVDEKIKSDLEKLKKELFEER